MPVISQGQREICHLRRANKRVIRYVRAGWRGQIGRWKMSSAQQLSSAQRAFLCRAISAADPRQRTHTQTISIKQTDRAAGGVSSALLPRARIIPSPMPSTLSPTHTTPSTISKTSLRGEWAQLLLSAICPCLSANVLLLYLLARSLSSQCIFRDTKIHSKTLFCRCMCAAFQTCVLIYFFFAAVHTYTIFYFIAWKTSVPWLSPPSVCRVFA